MILIVTIFTTGLMVLKLSTPRVCWNPFATSLAFNFCIMVHKWVYMVKLNVDGSKC